jgi:glutathione S-transferase
MSQPHNNSLVFGYWALRGKAHMIRLVMEYLRIPYEDIVYRTPQSWYEDSLAKSSKATELPYLIDDGFVLDEAVPILNYILKKYGYENLLGQTI